ncbi:MAG: Ig-like domain repeat protein [Chloroflexi bacterium]|nr:Ig-like domain repeat protein [Chloroflexota bacterium]
MKFRRIFTPAVLIVTLLVQFLPGTVFAPRPVAASVACDAAEFVADVTIPDGTSFAPGTALIKTWRLKNIGTCTWSTSYAIVFYSGTKMGAPSAVNMPTSVAPGATVDVTVNMTAPTASGHYRGYWMLRNASNVLFGVGPYGTYWFFIDIVVAASSTSTAYDFVANYCSAIWTSGAGALSCPGTDGDNRGFVLKLDAPKLETGSTGPAGLLTFPQNITDGYIQGVYPAFSVQSGDHFMSIINCQYGATGCYVTFQLNYQIGSGPVYTLKTFREKIDGMYYNLDVNLLSLAGQNVKFILKVLAYGSPTGDRAIWAGARIARLGGPTPPPVSTCDKAAFVTDVTIPDGTALAGGTPFTKTWRLQNVGTCTWTTSYRLVFSGGDYMGATASAFNLPTSVAPGGTIDLSVNLTAPISAGNFIGYWKLRNASGTNFGVGASGTSVFLVNINVVSSYGSAYDFVANANSASWSSGAGALPWPGTDGDARGFVLPLGSHQMEDGISSSKGLLTFPQYVTDGYIQGIYPGFTVQSGDHFQSYIGCQYGGPTNCYIVFRLAYQIGSGPVYTLKTAAERLEGLVYRMDVDLSGLAGSNVKFILKVEAFGSPSGDRAVWSAPRIVRSGSVPPGPTSTTTTITSDAPDPSIPGQSVTVSVTVSGSGTTPTGTMAIAGADTNCTISLSGGSGSCNVVFNTTGAKTLTATYSGDVNYTGSSDTESHTVSQGPSTTTITADLPDPSAAGGTVPVSATVSGAGATPTGTVTITGADAPCTITLIGGSGSCNVVFSTTGAFTLTAIYSGDSNYTISSNTESHTVN